MAITRVDHLDDRVRIFYEFIQPYGSPPDKPIDVLYESVSKLTYCWVSPLNPKIFIPHCNDTIYLCESEVTETPSIADFFKNPYRSIRRLLSGTTRKRYEVYRNAATMPSESPRTGDASTTADQGSSGQEDWERDYENYTPGHGGTWGSR